MKSNVELKFGIGCTFAWEKFKADGTITERGEPFHNLVLDSGLLKLFSYSLMAMMTYINIGSGTSAPVATETGLVNRLYSTNVLFNSIDLYVANTIENWYGRRKIFQFGVGTCTGTFAEVGLSRVSNGDYLNRQLFKDGSGNPVTITIGADEGLRLIVEGRYYLDSAMSQYSEVYELKLKGATAGSIVIGNGVTTKSITVARLANTIYLRTDLCALRDVDSVVRVEITSSNTLIYGHPINNTSLNFSIVSHTLTGGTGEPELTQIKPFNPKNKTGSFVLNDETLGQQTTINYKLYALARFGDDSLRFPQLKAVAMDVNIQFSQWGFNGNGNAIPYVTLTALAQALRLYQDGWTIPSDYSSCTVTKAPIAGDLSIDVKIYYAPGKLGTGDKVICGIAHASATRMGAGFQAIFDPMITITDEEDIDFTATLSISAHTP